MQVKNISKTGVIRMKNNNEYILRLWTAVAVLAIAIIFLLITYLRLYSEPSKIGNVDRLLKMNIGKIFIGLNISTL